MTHPMIDGYAEDVSVDDILGEYVPPTHKVNVLTRADLQQRLEDLEAELKAASRSTTLDSGVGGVLERIAEVEREAEPFVREFVFQSIGNKAWSDLMAEHPPKKSHREVGLGYNGDTFPPAAVAASCVKPSGMTEKNATLLMEGWSVGQWAELWTGCLKANGKVSGVPFSAAASVLRRDSEPNSTIAPSEASPTASS